VDRIVLNSLIYLWLAIVNMVHIEYHHHHHHHHFRLGELTILEQVLTTLNLSYVTTNFRTVAMFVIVSL
jgi:hypothetical protein